MAVRMTLPSLALPRAARRVSAQRASFAGNRVALKASAPVSVRGAWTTAAFRSGVAGSRAVAVPP